MGKTENLRQTTRNATSIYSYTHNTAFIGVPVLILIPGCTSDLFTAGTVKNAVVQWLRCCATNWKVAGSIPDGVIGILHFPIALWPWGRLSF